MGALNLNFAPPTKSFSGSPDVKYNLSQNLLLIDFNKQIYLNFVSKPFLSGVLVANIITCHYSQNLQNY